MPQPKQTANPAPIAQAESNTATLVPGSPAWLIEQAEDLIRQQGKLNEKIVAVRQQLRTLDKLDGLDEKQQEWLDTVFPYKAKGERRDKDEIEATRKAREAIRRNGR